MPALRDLIDVMHDRERARKDFEATLRSENLSRGELYNRLALIVAREFDGGAMSFDVADAIINDLWGMIVDDLDRKGFGIPKPAYSIYEAFDQGEFDHGDGKDPVETCTRPLIREILQAAGEGN